VRHVRHVTPARSVVLSVSARRCRCRSCGAEPTSKPKALAKGRLPSRRSGGMRVRCLGPCPGAPSFTTHVTNVAHVPQPLADTREARSLFQATLTSLMELSAP
jgi:hypothetical protein